MADMVAPTGKQLSATKLVIVRRLRQYKIGGVISALRDGLEHLVTVSRWQDALRRVSTLVIAPLVLVSGRVPYAPLVGQIPALDDHHLVVLVVAALLVAEVGLVVDGVSELSRI